MTSDEATRLIHRRARALALATREERPDAPVRVATRIDPRNPDVGLDAPWTCIVTVHQGDVVVLRVDSPGDDPTAALYGAPEVLKTKILDVTRRLHDALSLLVDGADLVEPPEPPSPPAAAEVPRRTRRPRSASPSEGPAGPQLSLTPTPKDPP